MERTGCVLRFALISWDDAENFRSTERSEDMDTLTNFKVVPLGPERTTSHLVKPVLVELSMFLIPWRVRVYDYL